MKKLMIAVAAFMVSIAAYGQGQFVFNNRNTAEGINVPFVTDSGVKLAGTAYTVQLLGGATGTAVANLQPIGTTDFRTGAAAGYVNQISPSVPGVGEGKQADILLRVFQGTSTTGNPLSSFGPFTVTVHEAPATPVSLTFGANAQFTVATIPEPATLALGALGLGALLAIRRRS